MKKIIALLLALVMVLSLAACGKEEKETAAQDNKDITENYYDTEARLESAKIREERVLEILKNSSKLDDVLALERELAFKSGITEFKEGWQNFLVNITYSLIPLIIWIVVIIILVIVIKKIIKKTVKALKKYDDRNTQNTADKDENKENK